MGGDGWGRKNEGGGDEEKNRRFKKKINMGELRRAWHNYVPSLDNLRTRGLTLTTGLALNVVT